MASSTLAYATTVYGAQGETTGEGHVALGEHTSASSAYVGMTRGRVNNIAHLVAANIDDARRQWDGAFSRDRADLGPGHAARRAARGGRTLRAPSTPRRCPGRAAGRLDEGGPATGRDPPGDPPPRLGGGRTASRSADGSVTAVATCGPGSTPSVGAPTRAEPRPSRAGGRSGRHVENAADRVGLLTAGGGAATAVGHVVRRVAGRAFPDGAQEPVAAAASSSAEAQSEVVGLPGPLGEVVADVSASFLCPGLRARLLYPATRTEATTSAVSIRGDPHKENPRLDAHLHNAVSRGLVSDPAVPSERPSPR